MYIVGLLILIVIAVFVIKPDLLGNGGDNPTFVFVPTETSITFDSNFACVDVAGCEAQIVAEGYSTHDFLAACVNGYCTITAEKSTLEALQ